MKTNCKACGDTGLVLDITDTDRGDEMREVACSDCEDRERDEYEDDDLATYADRANAEDEAMPNSLDEDCWSDE